MTADPLLLNFYASEHVLAFLLLSLKHCFLLAVFRRLRRIYHFPWTLLVRPGAGGIRFSAESSRLFLPCNTPEANDIR